MSILSHLKELLPKELRYRIRFAPIMKEDAANAAAFAANPDEQKRLTEAFEACNDIGDYVEFAMKEFETLQQRPEIIGLLEALIDLKAERICEIGTWGGGTNFMLNHCIPTAKDVIGLDLCVLNRFLLEHLKPAHNMHLHNGASCSASTLKKVNEILKGEKLDFCFIDGDHTYNGVKNDFKTYRHLVREGGIIAFHDINPDHGEKNGPCAGDVPVFWKEIKDHFEHKEFVANPGVQAGYGIGIIYYKADALPKDF